MIRPTLLRIDDDTQARCPSCSRFLPGWRGQDEIVCSSCGAVYERRSL